MPKRRDALRSEEMRGGRADVSMAAEQRRLAAAKQRAKVKRGMSPNLNAFASVKKHWMELPSESALAVSGSEPVVLDPVSGVLPEEDSAKKTKIAKDLESKLSNVTELVLEPLADMTSLDVFPASEPDDFDCSADFDGGDTEEDPEDDFEAFLYDDLDYQVRPDGSVIYLCDCMDPGVLPADGEEESEFNPCLDPAETVSEDVSDLDFSSYLPVLPHLASVDDPKEEESRDPEFLCGGFI